MTETKLYHLSLNGAELGLLIMILLEDMAKGHGVPIVFRDIIHQTEARSDELFVKLNDLRNSITGGLHYSSERKPQ